MGAALPFVFAAQAGMSIYGAQAQNKAEKARSKYESAAAQQNADNLRLQADDAIRRGDESASIIRNDTTLVGGAQKAAYAGGGVDVNSGTAAAVQAESRAIGEADEITARGNAWRESWGLKAQARGVESSARMAAIESKFRRRQTLITGGLQALQAGGNLYGARGGAPRGPSSTPMTKSGRVHAAPSDYYLRSGG